MGVDTFINSLPSTSQEPKQEHIFLASASQGEGLFYFDLGSQVNTIVENLLLKPVDTFFKFNFEAGWFLDNDYIENDFLLTQNAFSSLLSNKLSSFSSWSNNVATLNGHLHSEGFYSSLVDSSDRFDVPNGGFIPVDSKDSHWLEVSIEGVLQAIPFADEVVLCLSSSVCFSFEDVIATNFASITGKIKSYFTYNEPTSSSFLSFKFCEKSRDPQAVIPIQAPFKIKGEACFFG